MKVVNQHPAVPVHKTKVQETQDAAARSHSCLRDWPLPSTLSSLQFSSYTNLTSALKCLGSSDQPCSFSWVTASQRKNQKRSFPPGQWLFYWHIFGEHLNGKSHKDQAELGPLLSNEMSLLSAAVFLDRKSPFLHELV